MGTEASQGPSPQQEVIGRYVLYAPIARGGMATVHLARLVGAEGFSRLVAAKRLHAHLLENKEFVTMFMDEARIASKIHHPNVVPVLDVVVANDEVVLVQEYVHGLPLDTLMREARSRMVRVPPAVAVAIAAGVLSGLHAAHETSDEMGKPLHIVHRDVSPQNVMLTFDGTARLLDFGIAKAASSVSVTREGVFKGKVAYMAGEQLRGEAADRRADIYAAGVILWELLAGKRLHSGKTENEMFSAVLHGTLPSLVDSVEGATGDERRALSALTPILSKALALHASDRFPTAEEMLTAMLKVQPAAPPSEVSAWVKAHSGEFFEQRQRVIASHEESWRHLKAGSLVREESSGAATAMGAEVGARATRSIPPESARGGKRSLVVPLVAVGLISGVTALLGAKMLAGPGAMAAREGGVAQAAAAPLASPSAQATAAPSPQAASTPSPSPQASAPPTADSASAQAAGAQKADAGAATTGGHAPKTNRAARAAPADAPPATAAAPKADCNPPFYMDGTKKVYKPQCL